MRRAIAVGPILEGMRPGAVENLRAFVRGNPQLRGTLVEIEITATVQQPSGPSRTLDVILVRFDDLVEWFSKEAKPKRKPSSTQP